MEGKRKGNDRRIGERNDGMKLNSHNLRQQWRRIIMQMIEPATATKSKSEKDN